MKNLTEYVTDYINMRCSLGYKLVQDESLLNQFIDFLSDQGTDVITSSLVFAWATLPKNVQSAHWRKRLTTVRLFTQYLKNFDPLQQIPESGLIKASTKRTKPYIYSDVQVIRLLEACLATRTRGLRHLTYYTFFGLLIVTGCRVGELVQLKDSDVDLEKKIIMIRRSKNDTSRNLVLHSTVVSQLRQYSKERNKFHGNLSVNEFFLSEKGTALTVHGIDKFYASLSKKIKFRKPKDSHGPRIHDFRHSFAVTTVIQWYQQERDVNLLMPSLSTYLGHKNPSNTYWYLSNVPQLMTLAASKLETGEELL